MRKLSLILSSALLAFSSSAVRADVVGMKTTKPVGETLTLALNADLSATITWGNNKVSETLVFDGNPVELEIKSDSLTITSVSGEITRLYVPSAGLVSLNTSGAPSLSKLMCSGNSLTSLSLTRNTMLTELDCSDNRLTELALNSNRSLEEVNCSGNELAGLSYGAAGVTSLHTLICSGNSIDTLRYQTNLISLRNLWAAGNSLRVLNLSRASQLRSVVVPGNALTKLDLPSSSVFTDLWAEHNRLSSVDLSGVVASLRAVSLNDNALSTITWTNRAANLTDFYAHENRLFFSSFPLLTGTDIHYSLMPQSPYPLAVEFIIGERYNLKNQLSVNGYGTAPVGLQLKLHNAAGDELVKNVNGDYVLTNGNWTFKTEQPGAYITAEASYAYPGVSLRTAPFNVVFTSGIASAPSADALAVSTASGSLSVTASAPVTVTVVSASGVTVARERVGAGTRTWHLPAGLYVINGHKALVK